MKNNRKGGQEMTYNYNRLRGKIAEICGTKSEFAKRLGIASATLYAKLHNQTDFTQSEICKSCEILGIDFTDVPRYFFTYDVA